MKTIQEMLAITKFEDAAQANEFMSAIANLLESPALIEWAKVTDTNFETNTHEKLVEANQAFDDFYNEILEAC